MKQYCFINESIKYMKKKLSITEIQNLIIDKEKFIFTPFRFAKIFLMFHMILPGCLFPGM